MKGTKLIAAGLAVLVAYGCAASGDRDALRSCIVANPNDQDACASQRTLVEADQEASRERMMRISAALRAMGNPPQYNPGSSEMYQQQQLHDQMQAQQQQLQEQMQSQRQQMQQQQSQMTDMMPHHYLVQPQGESPQMITVQPIGP